MFDLYCHIESLGKQAGFKNMTVLCKAAGVPRATMSELNAGRSKDISKTTAQKFASLLGVTLETVYGTEIKKAPTVSGERDEADKVISFLSSLPPDRLRGILLALGAPEDVLAEVDRTEQER